MPTYSYRCANCDHAFDQYQAFADDSLTICPNCGQPQLRKVFNAIGVSFKGAGFYRTDSRATQHSSDGPGSKDKTATKDKPGSGSSGTSGASGDGGSSSKPEKSPQKSPASTGAATSTSSKAASST